MAGVNPPFKEWADVVRVAATDTKRRADVPDMAEVADRAERHGEATAPPTTHFVPDTTRRRRPKGETDTDDPDEDWPPSLATVARWQEDGTERMHAKPSSSVGTRIRQPKPKGKVIKPRKQRTSKQGHATAGRVASAQPKRGKQR